MSSSNSPISLNEFTENTRNGGSGRWCDKLPEKIREEIIASNAGSKVAADWLREVHGFEAATPKKCEPLMEERKKRNAG
ncbi:MAG: hypothetical protein CMG34_04830 [Candidatus Marinimicrobia bacterium]|nr:hypothetical protein [Candidatus Neomarinimicrobiota bacterium]|tara:strand:- start:10738 stop:10974 length:237 start_codon:yes stop_codon:yes gene_type:complete